MVVYSVLITDNSMIASRFDSGMKDRAAQAIVLVVYGTI